MRARGRATFVQRSCIAASADAVFRWHAQPGALARLVPPWERVEVLAEGPIEPGSTTILRVAVGPFRRRWVARIAGCTPGREFVDLQVEGPFAFWEHTHRMVPDGADGCWLEDSVSYTLPGGWLAHLAAGGLVRSKLRRMFAYRHRVTAEAFRPGSPLP